MQKEKKASLDRYTLNIQGEKIKINKNKKKKKIFNKNKKF